MSINDLIDRIEMTCTCCGANHSVGCECWEEDKQDQCDRRDGFGCEAHCRCPRCAATRASGPWRVYIQTGDTRTACGRKIPDGKWITWPAIHTRGHDCKRCVQEWADQMLVAADIPLLARKTKAVTRAYD